MKPPKITIALQDIRKINAYRKMINASDPENLVILDDKGSSIEHDPRDLEEWKLSGLNTWDYFSMFLKQT